MKRWGLVAGWVLLLALTTGLTWQIVSAADAQVSDEPAAINVAAPTAPTLSSVPVTSVATSPTTVPGTTSGTGGGSTSSSTSTTAAAPVGPDSGWSIKTIPSAGGTVVVTYRPEEVVLETATPKAGFRAEIDKAGPPKVEVEFESDDSNVEIRAEWKDGGLDIEVKTD